MPTQSFHWLGGICSCARGNGVQVMFGMEFAALAGPVASSAEEILAPATSKQHNAGTKSVLTLVRIAKAPDQWRTTHCDISGSGRLPTVTRNSGLSRCMAGG